MCAPRATSSRTSHNLISEKQNKEIFNLINNSFICNHTQILCKICCTTDITTHHCDVLASLAVQRSVSECYLGVWSVKAAISLKVWIAGLSNRKMSGCFSGSTCTGYDAKRMRCSWFSFLGSVFSCSSANVGMSKYKLCFWLWNNTKVIVESERGEKTYGS